MFNFRRLILLFSIMFMGIVGVKAEYKYYIVYVLPSDNEFKNARCDKCGLELSKCSDQLYGPRVNKSTVEYRDASGGKFASLPPYYYGLRQYDHIARNFRLGREKQTTREYDPCLVDEFNGGRPDFYFMSTQSNERVCLDCIFKRALQNQDLIKAYKIAYEPPGVPDRIARQFCESGNPYLKVTRINCKYGKENLAKIYKRCDMCSSGVHNQFPDSCEKNETSICSKVETHISGKGKNLFDKYTTSCVICKRFRTKNIVGLTPIEEGSHTYQSSCSVCEVFRSLHDLVSCEKCFYTVPFGCILYLSPCGTNGKKIMKCPKCETWTMSRSIIYIHRKD